MGGFFFPTILGWIFFPILVYMAEHTEQTTGEQQNTIKTRMMTRVQIIILIISTKKYVHITLGARNSEKNRKNLNKFRKKSEKLLIPPMFLVKFSFGFGRILLVRLRPKMIVRYIPGSTPLVLSLNSKSAARD